MKPCTKVSAIVFGLTTAIAAFRMPRYSVTLACLRRVHPAQPGEAGEVTVGRMEYSSIFHRQSGQLSVGNQRTAHVEGETAVVAEDWR